MNIQELIRPNVRKMKPYSSARDEFKERADIYLDANENPYDNGLNRYPDPYQKELKNLLSEIKEVSTEKMLLGNGSDEVLDLIFRAFCEPGEDNVILVPPTYGMYGVLAELNNIKTREVLLNSDFSLNTEKILAAADENTKAVFLASPNNPTGNAFAEKDVETLLENLSVLVVIDEAYVEFSGKKSWKDKIDRYPNLIVTQTLSKAYGLAGIRLGIAMASAEIIDVLNKIKPPYNVSTSTQKIALEQLKNRAAFTKRLEEILQEKQKLKKSLEQMPFTEKVYPSDANFWLVKVKDARKVYEGLLKQGIVIRDRSREPLCENCVRITVGTPDQNKKLIRAMHQLRF